MSIDKKIRATEPTKDKVTEQSDEEWEDEPDFNLARTMSSPTRSTRESSGLSNASSTSRTMARRRTPGKTVFVAAQTPRAQLQARRSPRERQLEAPPRIKPQSRPVIDRDQVQDAVVQSVAETVRYAGSVFTHAFWLLKRPLGILCALYMLSVLLVRLSNTLRVIASPFCWVPGISRSPLCRPPQVAYTAEGDAIPMWADYPKLVEIQSSNFEQLLDGSVGGSGLSLEIKKAEMASRDLITLVKFSELRSRDPLAESLMEFVEDAKKTGKGLQRLTTKVNHAVDRVLAINDHALRTIESAQKEPKSFLSIISPFVVSVPAVVSQEVVVEAFRDSMDVHAAEMRRLVLELDVSEANLERLDAHLVALHELCTRENLTLGAVREDLLAELWTRLGGNRKRLRGVDHNLALLRDLGEYRFRAAAHVAAAKQTLQAMGEDMEDLRERVAAPDIVGDRIPIEVHMRSIQSGLERLKEDRVKAKEREEQLMNKILGVDA
ncbi:hypothetical protein BD413DRAFT_532700 [Trametes elegans]|nr:hypothetical protein BD413DRAFT_532700 [Trametes elegans]